MSGSTEETVGCITGVCVLVEFPDKPQPIDTGQVYDFLNTPKYDGNGNNGSVFDYFYDNSAGKLVYQNLVPQKYTTIHNRAYYEKKDPADSNSDPLTWRESDDMLVTEVLDHLKTSGFPFQVLSTDGDNHIRAISVLFAGKMHATPQEGLRPHKSQLGSPYVLMPAGPGELPITALQYMLAPAWHDTDGKLCLGTFCHETGHLLCGFPDLNDDSAVDEWKRTGEEGPKPTASGIGAYCLMGGGASADPRNPVNICAYLKYRAGWATSVTHISEPIKAKAVAGMNGFFIHNHATPTEYFIIENRQKTGRDASLPDSGLAIWHIDELGSNGDRDPGQNHECLLMQADGRDDLEHGVNRGDASDLFKAPDYGEFSDDTRPASKWWDGTASGLRIYDVSCSRERMSFKADVQVP